jgi:hypothetical protein
VAEGWLPGDFAVVHSRAAVGRLVHALQDLSGGGPDYEHVIMGMPAGQIVEAMPGGAVQVKFHYDPADVWWSTNRLPIRMEPSAYQRRLIVASAQLYAEENVGYSFADYLALAAHTWHLPAPGLEGYVKSTRHMICSQLADKCYEDAGVHLFNDGRWNGYVRPADLGRLISAPDRGGFDGRA